LKSLLERFPILLVGCVFNGDGVVTFADFTALLHFSLAPLLNIYKSRRGSWVRDKLRNVIMQQTTWVSATIPSNQYSEANVTIADLVRRTSRRVLGDWARSIRWHILEYLAQPLDNVIIIDFIARHP
jgi:hypothetical protein